MIPPRIAEPGETVTICKITGKDEVRQHLAELGFVVDGSITVVSEISRSLILRVKGGRTALNRDTENRILFLRLQGGERVKTLKDAKVGETVTVAYFIGMDAVVLSGIMPKKCKAFAGEAAPFGMELPAYDAHAPVNVLQATWERGWSFIKRTDMVILFSPIALWSLQGCGFVGASRPRTVDEGGAPWT